MTTSQQRAAELFLAGGCIRRPRGERLVKRRPVYKKGWEVRFYVGSEPEAAEAQKLLKRAGLGAGEPYRKGPHRWIVPLYGRDPVEQFIGWVREVERL